MAGKILTADMRVLIVGGTTALLLSDKDAKLIEKIASLMLHVAWIHFLTPRDLK